MAKAARGTKRVCQHCGGKFYDLNRSPIVCPLCNEEFILAEAKPEEDEITPAEQPEAKQAAPDKALKTAIEPDADVEIVDDLDDELADLEDTGDDALAADDGDDTFLEAEDDDDGDVTGIIGTQIPKDEDDG